jgi:osmotically-inducible protein OsmY
MTTDDRRGEDLRRRIVDELEWDALIDATQIDVQVDGDTVTLIGTVPTFAEKLAAEEATRAVDGVHDVIDEIDVEPTDSHPTDQALRSVVEQVLSWDALVPEKDLTVEVMDGWVTLSGRVSTRSQADEAQRVARHLHGVRGVSDEMTIVPPDLPPAALRDAIGDALRRRAAHRADHISITVDGPIVTLRGVVQTPGEKTAILGAVSHAPGVANVRDELRVDPAS